MPNRIIKESIHGSEKVNRMSDFQFRLWVNLITYVDDYGRGDARPAIIKGTCFPLRERLTNKDISAALKALADIGCVSLYELDGRPYLCLPNWGSHQNIRNKKSKFPAPPDNLQTFACNCKQMQANAPVIQSESESESESNPPLPPTGGSAPVPLPLDSLSGRPILREAVVEWLGYKKETFRFTYKPIGLKALCEQVRENGDRFGDEAVRGVIKQSISSSYQGIVWDRLGRGDANGRNVTGGGGASSGNDAPRKKWGKFGTPLE